MSENFVKKILNYTENNDICSRGCFYSRTQYAAKAARLLYETRMNMKHPHFTVSFRMLH